MIGTDAKSYRRCPSYESGSAASVRTYPYQLNRRRCSGHGLRLGKRCFFRQAGPGTKTGPATPGCLYGRWQRHAPTKDILGNTDQMATLGTNGIPSGFPQKCGH
jgi:hypothetical protein